MLSKITVTYRLQIKRMKQLTLIAAILVGTIAQAQDKTFVVQPEQRISDVVGAEDMYAFPAFSQGTVYFTDGSSSSALMNYNALYGEIQFIDPKGDTLSLADENRIKVVTINNDSFYFDSHGLMQELASAGKGRVLRRTIIRQSTASKVGLYDQTVNGGAASSYSSLSSGAHDANLIVKQKVTLTKESTYFFGDDRGHLQPASRKSAEKVFSDKKAVIADYLSKNNVNFKNSDDLKNFVTYLQAH